MQVLKENNGKMKEKGGKWDIKLGNKMGKWKVETWKRGK